MRIGFENPLYTVGDASMRLYIAKAPFLNNFLEAA
jgi:hypothetical protein